MKAKMIVAVLLTFLVFAASTVALHALNLKAAEKSTSVGKLDSSARSESGTNDKLLGESIDTPGIPGKIDKS